MKKLLSLIFVIAIFSIGCEVSDDAEDNTPVKSTTTTTQYTAPVVEDVDYYNQQSDGAFNSNDVILDLKEWAEPNILGNFIYNRYFLIKSNKPVVGNDMEISTIITCEEQSSPYRSIKVRYREFSTSSGYGGMMTQDVSGYNQLIEIPRDNGDGTGFQLSTIYKLTVKVKDSEGIVSEAKVYRLSIYD